MEEDRRETMSKTIDLKEYKKKRKREYRVNLTNQWIQKYWKYSIAVLFILYLLFFRSNAYKIYYGEQYIGTYKKDEKAVAELFNIAQHRKKEELEAADIKPLQYFELKRTRASKRNWTSPDVIVTHFLEDIKVHVKVTAIQVDDKDVIIIGNRNKAEDILNEMIEKYKKKHQLQGELTFKENVELVERYENQSKVMNDEQVKKILAKTKTSEEVYVVKAGDSFSSIEARYEMPQGALQQLNPQIQPTKIREGDKLRIQYQKPIITIIQK